MNFEDIKKGLKEKGIKFYYEDKAGIIINADCLDVMPQIPDKSIDLVLTDPPYGMNKDFANDKPEEADAIVKKAVIEMRRICKDNLLCFWSAQRFNLLKEVFGDYKRVMIWNKTFAIYAPNKVGYRYEPIVWVAGGKANENRGDIIEGFPIVFQAQQENECHPTQKPLRVIGELVRDFSKTTDVILDPFLGSGTTARAAKDLGRKFIGIEISEKYCELSAKRLGQEVLFS